MSFRPFLSLLVLFALALAPAPMSAGSPALATGHQDEMATSHHSPAASEHPCAGDQAPSNGVAHDCCVMSCGAIPAVGGGLAPVLAPPSLRQPLSLGWDAHGLAPEADPPPPRYS
jgi:hypothetical protein